MVTVTGTGTRCMSPSGAAPSARMSSGTSTRSSIQNSILSHGRRAGSYLLLRKTEKSWNTPAPLVIRIWMRAGCGRGRSTGRGATVRRSRHHRPACGELKSKLRIGAAGVELQGRVSGADGTHGLILMDLYSV